MNVPAFVPSGLLDGGAVDLHRSVQVGIECSRDGADEET
jgi:hypothetical protein